MVTLSFRNGKVVGARRATGVDVARFRLLLDRLGVNYADIARRDEAVRATRIVVGKRNIKVEYSNGWSEEVRNGRYRLRDAFGRNVTERPATDADQARLRALLPE
ncbi:hypothetical protein ACFQBU_18240 [Jhaorihella thermophila]|uniref:Uncharacterized protein n=2 Tax=Jhaorihella thermophila TaxID=488547 RepID=A0A1H5YLT8_9RHOB|nr:hypothetical protein SAMN05421751_12027 [Jhaorihella thermophila]